MKPLQNNKITKFLLISFLISWGFGWGLLAFLTQMGLLSLTSPLGVFLHLLGGFGPTIAAISCLPQKSIKSIVSFILGDSKKYIFLFLLRARNIEDTNTKIWTPGNPMKNKANT